MSKIVQNIQSSIEQFYQVHIKQVEDELEKAEEDDDVACLEDKLTVIKSLHDDWMSESNQTSFKKILSKVSAKTRKKKDPNAPTGACTPFILYGKDERKNITKDQIADIIAEVNEENADDPTKKPLTTGAAMGKIIGRMWGVADKDTKDKYIAMAAEDKERYKLEMESYTPSEPNSEDENPKGSRKKKPKGAPIGKRSAFIFFKKEQGPKIREEDPTLDSSEVTKEISTQWALLQKENPDEHQRYKDLSAEDKERYDREMEEYVPLDDDKIPKAPKAKSKKLKIGEEHTMKGLLLMTKPVLLAFAHEMDLKVSDSSTKATIADLILEAEGVQPLEVPTGPFTNDELMEMTRDEVAAIAKSKKLVTTGKKQEIVDRILEPTDESSEMSEGDVVRKKVKNPFSRYAKEQRKPYKIEHPEASAPEVTEGLKTQWKALTKEEKEVYEYEDEVEASDE